MVTYEKTRYNVSLHVFSQLHRLTHKLLITYQQTATLTQLIQGSWPCGLFQPSSSCMTSIYHRLIHYISNILESSYVLLILSSGKYASNTSHPQPSLATRPHHLLETAPAFSNFRVFAYARAMCYCLAYSPNLPKATLVPRIPKVVISQPQQQRVALDIGILHRVD